LVGHKAVKVCGVTLKKRRKPIKTFPKRLPINAKLRCMSKLAEKLELSATLECDEYNKLLLFLMGKPLGECKLKKPHGESSLRHTPKELT